MALPSETATTAPDGTRLVECRWPAAGGWPDAGCLLLVHGLGEHPRRYGHVAGVLNSLGLEVRSYDQRGFGRSGGTRGALPRAEALVEDLAWMFERLTRERRGREDVRPPFVLGHSLGGCVVARAVTGGRIKPRGMILSSPSLLPRLAGWQRLLALAGTRLFPSLRVRSGLPMHLVSHDAEIVAAIGADPDMHDLVTPRLVAFLIEAGRASIGDAARCQVPTLILAAGEDHFCDPEGSRAFHARLPPGVGTLRIYERLYHEVFNEPATDRARVLADLAQWLDGRLRAPGQTMP